MLLPVAIPALCILLVLTLDDDMADEDEATRCKRVKASCIEVCSDTTLPTFDFGWKFRKCLNKCLEENGCPRDS